jgi:hypothetical protein
MRIHFERVLASILFLASARTVQAQNSAENVTGKPLISTGVTGSIKASDLDDPQYVLAFLPVQRLMMQAAHHPLSKADIDKAVQGTPVTLNRLLQLELLRKEEDTYRLNYLLLTIEDQQATAG